jgi:FkbM family methyltransferase
MRMMGADGAAFRRTHFVQARRIMNLSALSNDGIGCKAIRAALNMLPKGMTVPIIQGRLRGKRWHMHSCNHGCWLGSYEWDKRLAFESMAQPGDVVFDIGAHVGFYTLLAAELVGSSGRVVAFEPVPENLRYLKSHLRMNRVKNTVVCPVAVGRGFGVMGFDRGVSSTQGRLSASAPLKVPVVGLDEYVAQRGFPSPKVIKMDIEGGELDALEGAKTLLSSVRPVIFLATHSPQLHRDCCQLLSELDYELAPLTPGVDLESVDELLATPR